MASKDLVRAWKDEEYRLSLSEAERALLPESPVGSLELTDAELDQVAGGGCSVLSIVIPFFETVKGNCRFLSVVIITRN